VHEKFNGKYGWKENLMVYVHAKFEIEQHFA
jgi:hypothetical protein